MFKRLYSNLFTPKEAGKYLKDRVGYVILYILFLSLLASIPIFIQLSYTNDRENQFKNNFISALSKKEVESNIVDYKFVGDDIDPFKFNDYIYIGLNSANISSFGLTFMFAEEELNIFIGNSKNYSYSYQGLGLDNIDLSFKNKEDAQKMESALSAIYKNFKTSLVIGESIATVFSHALLGIILILIIVAFNSKQNPKLLVKFRFILVSYVATVYFFTVLLDNLFGGIYFSIIGIIITGINYSKAYAETINLTMMVKEEEKIDE